MFDRQSKPLERFIRQRTAVVVVVVSTPARAAGTDQGAYTATYVLGTYILYRRVHRARGLDAMRLHPVGKV